MTPRRTPEELEEVRDLIELAYERWEGPESGKPKSWPRFALAAGIDYATLSTRYRKAQGAPDAVNLLAILRLGGLLLEANPQRSVRLGEELAAATLENQAQIVSHLERLEHSIAEIAGEQGRGERRAR